MNKIFNYCTALLLSVLALSLGSCTEEFEYTGTTVSGEQVYFSNALPTTVELSATANSVTVPVNRIQRSGELTVNLDVTVPEGSPLTVSNQATFADGDSVAYVTISYDPNAIEYGKYDTITVALNDASLTTPYGNTSYTFTAGLSEWVSMGTGSYCDAIYSSFYGIQALTYDVEIEENVLTPGVYRLTSPYGEGTDFYDTFIDTDTPSFLWAGSSNPGLVINATDPQHVYISGTCTPGTDDGMASQGYGVMRLYSVVDDYLSQGASLSQIAAQMPQCFGTLENGVITLPEMGIYIGFTDNINEILGYLDLSSGAVALPGYVISDYSSAFTYKGCFIDVAGNSYIQGTVTLGGDVASAKYVIAANGDDVQAIIDAVNDGSIEGTEITESGEVSIAMSESGDYNFIIITYDAAGNMQGSSATPFTFTSGSVVDDTDWQFVCNGTYYHVISPLFSDAEPLFDESNYTTTLYQDPENPSRYRISPWGGNPYVELSFDFTMNADNTITFADIESGWEVKDQQGNVYSLFGADAFTMSNQWPNSYYDPTENVYYFASVYYAIINGQAQPVYGEWDAFIPSGSAQNVMNMPAKAPYRLGAKKAKFTQKDLKGFTPEKYGKFVKVNRL